jgi:membrane-associated phospholipid phosphatase
VSASEHRVGRGVADPGLRRRRPSGAPPSLPRELGVVGWLWLGLLIGAAILAALLLTRGALLQETTGQWWVEWFAVRRTPFLDDAATAVNELVSPLVVLCARIAIVVALVAWRRWRHLLVFLLAVVVVSIVSVGLQALIGRPRPTGVVFLLDWYGFSFPDVPITAMACALAGLVYGVVPAGRWRVRSQIGLGVLLAAVGLARVYGGIAHPFDVVFALLIGLGIPIVFFRTWAPESVFPIGPRSRGKSAHLDVGGRRGEAIRSAMADQLGLRVLDMEPFGLEGSGASTPLRFSVEGVDGHLFGKLVARNHLRADRWYKLGRTILYGGLEDESRFQSVRRLIEYEDYALRLLEDQGFDVAHPYGTVEITPEREYLLVTGFFEGAKEIGDVDVTDALIDEGLALVRRLWDGNLAHRDIKPSNLLVRDGKVLLIDVGFVELHPTPWRQAVDLANMMLTLALRSDARRVYERAVLVFTPEEIAEGFAAVRGIAIPSQVAAALKADPRPLVAEFRALAPPRRPISIQRWSVRRVGLILATIGGGLLLVSTFVNVLIGGVQ